VSLCHCVTVSPCHCVTVSLCHCQLIYCVQDYKAKLADFGLAKDGPVGDKTHVTTQVVGTHGYADPDYIITGTPSLEVRDPGKSSLA